MKTLKSSFLIYRDDMIDKAKVQNLLVYGYPLTTLGDKFYQWKEAVDPQLSAYSYPYYMQGGTLYVALETPEQPLPTITSKDGTEIEPQKVEYNESLNPVWLKLLLRKVGHRCGKTKGYMALGKPLLKIGEWGGENPGFDVVSIDATVWQRRDLKTTEIAIKFENVVLRKVKPEDDLTKEKIWCYGKDKWLSRSFEGDQHKGVLYKEGKKGKGTRKTRPFIDLNTPKGMESSRSVFINNYIETFIEEAHKYGFYIQHETLNLEPYKSSHKPDGKKRLSSLPIENYPVYVVDARENLESDFADIVALFKEQLEAVGISTPLIPLEHQPHDLDKLALVPNRRYLVVIDQQHNLAYDPYQITSKFSDTCAIQHININPYELDDETNPEQWFIYGKDKQKNIVLSIADEYFCYDFSQIEAQASAITLKLTVCIKELHFKHLFVDSAAHVESYLPNHYQLLEGVTLISDGQLFTVEQGRPVVIPFKLSEHSALEALDRTLARHSTSTMELVHQILQDWPYKYVPEKDMHNDPDRFLKRMTVFLKGEDTILLQNPGYTKPILTPDGLNDIAQMVENRSAKQLPKAWVVPKTMTFEQLDTLLAENVSQNMREKLKRLLPDMVECWNRLLADIPSHQAVAIKGLMKLFNEAVEPIAGKNKQLLGIWWQVLSQMIDFPIYDPRVWAREVPGLKGLWYDKEKGYYLVGELNSLKLKIERQPSVYRWHALRGKVSPELLMPYLDVDFIRIGQYAGRIFPHMFIRCAKEISNV